MKRGKEKTPRMKVFYRNLDAFFILIISVPITLITTAYPSGSRTGKQEYNANSLYY